MPLHRIYYADGVFSSADKKAIAQRVTTVYTKRLPAFYVVVVFIAVDKDSLYVGGEPNDRFVRITTQHLARTNQGKETLAQRVEELEEAYAPYVRDRGFDWELHIDEGDRETWRVNGLRPPMPNTAEERMWVKANRPVPYKN
eukprot:jgi/Chrzof1/8977/Cz03g31190.t1